jgi:hypothetical protein
MPVRPVGKIDNIVHRVFMKKMHEEIKDVSKGYSGTVWGR